MTVQFYVEVINLTILLYGRIMFFFGILTMAVRSW